MQHFFMLMRAGSEGRQLLHNSGKSNYSIAYTETETSQTELYRKRPPTAGDMMALPMEDGLIRVPALFHQKAHTYQNRAASFLTMTNAQRIAMHFFIFAALLFVGESQGLFFSTLSEF